MSQQIPLTTAAVMTRRFRNNRESILKEEYENMDIFPVCETFDASSVNAVMLQNGVAKMRVYYGMDENLKVHAILVGVNESDEDIVPKTENEEDGVILEDAQRCPPVCPPTSPLNADGN